MADVEDLRAFWDRCKHADWFYDYSDDGRVYRAGQASMSKLRADARQSPERQAIYDGWDNHYFSGPHYGTDQKPAPVRP